MYLLLNSLIPEQMDINYHSKNYTSIPLLVDTKGGAIYTVADLKENKTIRYSEDEQEVQPPSAKSTSPQPPPSPYFPEPPSPPAPSSVPPSPSSASPAQPPKSSKPSNPSTNPDRMEGSSGQSNARVQRSTDLDEEVVAAINAENLGVPQEQLFLMFQDFIGSYMKSQKKI